MLNSDYIYKKEFYLQTQKQRNLFLEVILNGLSQSTATFMCWVYPALIHRDCNAKELGAAAHMTNSAALIHLKRLSQMGFVERVSFRAWRITEKSKNME